MSSKAREDLLACKNMKSTLGADHHVADHATSPTQRKKSLKGAKDILSIVQAVNSRNYSPAAMSYAQGLPIHCDQ